jgi:hypothetical protein
LAELTDGVLFQRSLPQVITETFTLSLLTAVLLKGVLEVVVVAKSRVRARLRGAATPAGKLLAAVALWAVLFGSKFMVLEVVALVFRDRVSLGGFFSVTLLIVVLLLSRQAVRRLLHRPRPRSGGQPRVNDNNDPARTHCQGQIGVKTAWRGG